MNYYKAFIRVVKSLLPVDDFLGGFGSETVITEKLIEAENKEDVKKILLERYPQFFPNNKVYSRETKDDAQFFYVVIFELYDYEKDQILSDTSWFCTNCGQKHENTYLSKPRLFERLFGADKMFCRSDDDFCILEYKKKVYQDKDLPDDETFIKFDSPNYIYKITEKSTGKCYIGKTRNAPFFRWWNHLTHSSSPFGLYLRNQTKLSDWTFEVLEELPANIEDQEVFDKESKYIIQFNSLENGYNTLISKKQNIVFANQPELF